MPGGNPVTAEPGETPRLPVMVEGPVFVTVEPPRTAKFCAVPREIWANAGAAAQRKTAITTTATALNCVRFISNVLSEFSSWFVAFAPPVGAPRLAAASVLFLRRHAQRHGDDERRAESEPGAFGAHRSAVQLHDLRDDRQADAEARQLIGGRSALAVQLEDGRQEGGADSAAGIDHAQAGVSAVPIEADVDAAAVRRELDRVAEQGSHDLQQPHGVGG